MIISRTPFRLSFFGGGTDYPVWFEKYGGAVLATSIDKYCYITCRYLPPYFEHKSKVVYSQFQYVKDNEEIEHPVIRECLKFMGITDGVEIYHHGDLPARRGLGSSSTFTVGLLNALYALKGISPNKTRLAQDAIYIEQDRIKESVGCQDQYLSAVGGFNYIYFERDGNVEVMPIKGNELQKYLMLFDTGTYRIASEIAKEQIKLTPQRRDELEEMYYLVGDAMTILNEGTRLLEFGQLLHRNWLLKRRLTDKISTPTIDAIYGKALKAGAMGGKLCGAGGGGYMLFFVEPEKQQAVREALEGLIYVPFRFEKSGSQIIFDGSS